MCQGHGKCYPMRRVALTLCVVLCNSCSTPHKDDGSTGPTWGYPPPSDAGFTAESEASSGPIAVAYTFEDWAKKLGVHLDVFLLASMGCARLLNCGWEIGIPSECAAAIVRVWCSDYSCSEAIFDAPYQFEGHDCRIDSLDRAACDSIDEPLQCEFLQSRGLEFRLTDGAPAGGWPVYTDDPPTRPWPQRDQSQSLPKSQDAPR